LNWPDATIAALRDLAAVTRADSAAEADELELLRCKIELRAAKLRDGRREEDPALAQVRSCLESFLARPRPAELVSEARGWIARTDWLRGRDAAAAKFYLEELSSTTSNIRRERLMESLQAIEPKLSDLDDYFDTPVHALFVANRVTNGSYHSEL